MMTRSFMVGALGILLSVPHASWALFGVGDVVIDPTNLVQNTLTAGNTIRNVAQGAQQVVHQVTQISNQVKAFEQDAKNFVSLPSDLSNQLTDLMGTYQHAMGTMQGISYQYTNTRRQFDDLYDTLTNPTMEKLLPMAQRALAAKLAQQSRDASRGAMEMQAITDSMNANQSIMRDAMSRVRSARGNLEVQQANGQLQGVVASQQQQLLQVVAASERLQTSVTAAQVTMDEMARQSATQAAGTAEDWSRCTGCDEGLTDLPVLR